MTSPPVPGRRLAWLGVPGRRKAWLNVIASVASLSAVVACSGGGSPHPSASPVRGVAAIDRAIEGVNATRGPLISGMNAVVVAANRVDAVDAISVKGDWQRATNVRTQNVVDAPGVTDVVGQLTARVRAYSAALNALSAAANVRGIPARPAEAVRQVVAVGRAETAADDAFVRAVVTSWPAYAVLSGLQTLWYERATSGWYSSHKLAAQEYAVLTGRNRPAIGRASRAFAATDPVRRAAGETWAQTLAQIEPLLKTDEG